MKFAGRMNDPFCKLRVDIKITGSRIGIVAKVTFHLAAFELFSDTLPHTGFQGAQFFRQPDRNIQVAMVDRANFPGGMTPFP